MESELIYFILSGLVLLWVLPAVFLSVMVWNLQLKSQHKKAFYLILWTLAMLGNLLSMLILFNTGKLNTMTKGEHRSFWVFGSRK